MFQSWLVDSPASGHSLQTASVATLLDAPHDAAPARRMLAFINQLVPVEYLSLVVYAGEAPTQVEGHAQGPGIANVTAECFDIYRNLYYRSDRATAIAAHMRREGAGGPVAAIYYRASDLPLAGWRNEIYERAHLAGRLSFLYAPLPRTVFAINLYRGEARGGFQPDEIDRLLGIAPLLRLVHRIVLRACPAGDAARPARAGLVDRAESAINIKAPQLSPRERQVCARIACGMSADGIAVDLGVAPSTVMTLRKRAYARLSQAGLHGGRLQLARWLT